MSIQTTLNAALYSRLAGTAATALTSLLSGGTATPSVFFEQAPDNAGLPYVVWFIASETEANETSHRIKEAVIRAYGVAAAPAQAGTIDAAIDTLLHGVNLSFGTASSWSNIWMKRESGYQLVTTSETGARYYTSGGDYRAIVTNG